MPTAVDELTEYYERGAWNSIDAAVSNGRSEALHLEFKRKQNASTPVLDATDRKHLSEALSGFANSDGGLLVWGVYARRVGNSDHAVGLHPICDSARFAHELTQATPDLVSPPVPGVRHFAIPNPSQPDEGVVVSVIPQSESTPHMARARGAHSYYRRAEGSFRPLEHYEIADLFGRRARPKIGAVASWTLELSSYDGAGNAIAQLRVRFLMRNSGRAIARYPAITIGHPMGYEALHWSGRHGGGGILHPTPAPTGSWLRLVGGLHVVVYPDDEFEAAYVTFLVRNTQTEFPSLLVPFQVIAADVVAYAGELIVLGEQIRSAAAAAFLAQGLSISFEA